MTVEELFAELDFAGDGELSRSELYGGALRLGWQWPEASLYAVLDLMTLRTPLSMECFATVMEQISRDPLGPYGEVLADAWRLSSQSGDPRRPAECCGSASANLHGESPGALYAPLVSHLEQAAGPGAGDDYRMLVKSLPDTRAVTPGGAALLLLDLQRSFTGGAWLDSLGGNAASEAEPIRLAFANCARFLDQGTAGVEKMFTRCPFPADSYDWDERFATLLGSAQPYFVKPGNSVLWPPANGFAQWLEGLIEHGRKTLLLGGCTLNSCVRVSAIDIQKHFGEKGIQVVVVLALSGARTGNYLPSPQFGGMSSVALAVREMLAAGVSVIPELIWA